MSEVTMRRDVVDVTITLHTTTALATTFRVNEFAGGVVSFGTMSTNATSLQVFGSNTPDGDFRRLYDASATAADITLSPSSTVGRIYALPDAAFALSYAKLVSATTHSTGTIGIVSLKS